SSRSRSRCSAAECAAPEHDSANVSQRTERLACRVCNFRAPHGKGVQMRAFGFFLAIIAMPAAATEWLQFGFDSSHSGVNPAETSLSPANVAQTKLLYSTALPGRAEGAPVLLTGVDTPTGTHDVLYFTINDGTLVALDAATGALLWSQHPSDTNACAMDAEPCFTASSPAIDPNRRYVYSYA